MERYTLAKNHIIKRAGKHEKFDTKKLYASIYASCLAAHESSRSAEKIADKVSTKVKQWFEEKNSLVTSNDIRQIASKYLENYSADAAYGYNKHRILW